MPAYGFGPVRNHPYRDGNKRVAFVVMVGFLKLNGLAFDAEEADVVATVVRLADGGPSEAELTEWVRERSRKRGTHPRQRNDS